MDARMLRANDALLVLVDVQGRLARLIDQSEILIARIALLIKALKELQVPIIWNEQVPDKLGETVPEIAALMEGEPLVKSCFSCAGTVEFMTQLAHSGRSQIMVAGIETHVCVHQSVAHLLQHDFEVHVISDAVGSRNAGDRQVGLQRMAQTGAYLSCVETALFEMLGDAQHPQFRAISALLKEA